MAQYVDCMLIPVPKKNLKTYLSASKKIAKIWTKAGALEYLDCQADDVKPGKITSIPQSVKLKKGEIVFCTFVVYNSRAHRDSVMKKVMGDPFFEDPRWPLETPPAVAGSKSPSPAGSNLLLT